MSQHDFDIANQGFAAFRADLNNALKALGSLSSGGAEPATTYANQLWYETDTNTLHIRDEVNSAWLDLMVIDQTTGSPSFTAGNVGIGTATPTSVGTSVTTLDIEGSLGGAVRFERTSATASEGYLGAFSGEFRLASVGAIPVTFRTDNTERMRIDSSGNLLVGKTSAATGTVGAELRANGKIVGTIDGGNHTLNRLTSDGSILQFSQDDTEVGRIGSVSGDLFWSGASGAGIRAVDATNRFYPCTNTGTTSDNTHDWGYSTARFNDIYATNGVTTTSDRNEKQDIEELSEAERRVAVACKGLLRKYRWISSVAQKGDDARIHFGIIAQDLQAAFAAEGLDAGRYGMFISSTWWEHDGKIYDTAEDAPEGATERTRLGVRYPELLAFIIAVL